MKTLLDWLLDFLSSFTVDQATEERLRGISPDAKLLGSGTTSVPLGSGYEAEAEEIRARAAIVAFLEKQVGDPYKWGAEANMPGQDLDGWDCSELMEQAHLSAGKAYPDGCVNQLPVVRHRKVSEPKPGDPFFLGPNASGIPHTGAYVGQGYCIHAAGRPVGKVVRISLAEIQNHARFLGFFRHPEFAWPAEERIVLG